MVRVRFVFINIIVKALNHWPGTSISNIIYSNVPGLDLLTEGNGMVSGEIDDKSFERVNNAIQQDIGIGNISQLGHCLRERTGICT